MDEFSGAVNSSNVPAMLYLPQIDKSHEFLQAYFTEYPVDWEKLSLNFVALLWGQRYFSPMLASSFNPYQSAIVDDFIYKKLTNDLDNEGCTYFNTCRLLCEFILRDSNSMKFVLQNHSVLLNEDLLTKVQTLTVGHLSYLTLIVHFKSRNTVPELIFNDVDRLLRGKGYLLNRFTELKKLDGITWNGFDTLLKHLDSLGQMKAGVVLSKAANFA
jgi:hypothetical protein